MSFDRQKITESKDAYHRKLAVRPFAEKLRLLDAMRERALAIRSATVRGFITVQETPGQYQSKRHDQDK